MAPMLALTFATMVSVALVIARIFWTGKLAYAFLIWNLLLAWLPLILALHACENYVHGKRQSFRFYAQSGAWLLFYPNAPYIFTDIIHLNSRFFGHFWPDLMLILTCALTGLVVGFVSLYLMQSVVSRRFGAIVGWFFIAAVAVVSGFGMYFGRFLRFNTWDVLFRPVKLYESLGSWASDSLSSPVTIALPILFAAFLFTTYLMLYALTHLSSVQKMAAVPSAESLAKG